MSTFTPTMKRHIILMAVVLINSLTGIAKPDSNTSVTSTRPRIIVTTDGEEDDRASMVRFLLSSNEFDIEGIINSSSQFHWVGGKGWNAFHPVDWVKEYIGYYRTIYPNLLLHDSNYPSPDYLLSKWKVGNIDGVGNYNERTEGARFIAETLLDDDDSRPIWIQAWGGCNTLAAALKIIQDDYPQKMREIATKMRLFLIWEQDDAYQKYIRPNWEHLNIPTIISDQFDCMAYIWDKVLPQHVQSYFCKDWMTDNIIVGHGVLCDAYPNRNGAFNAEGDTPAFLHSIDNGLRNMENPGFGGWGGRYVNIRNNVWMDPVPSSDFVHPTDQWGFSNSWSKKMEHYTDSADVAVRTNYFKPIWRWLIDVQNDFAARADWCVKDYDSANHHPIIRLKSPLLDIKAKIGDKIALDASKSEDPDGDRLTIHWWTYAEAGTYNGIFSLDSNKKKVNFKIPEDAHPGDKIHIICQVSDDGTPVLTKYKRLIIEVIE